MQIVEYYALLFYHLIYLRAYSKSVPKQLSHSSNDCMLFQSVDVICVIGSLQKDICIIPTIFMLQSILHESPSVHHL